MQFKKLLCFLFYIIVILSQKAVKIAEKILRRNPKHINYLAPAVTYFLTIFAGTGHTAFSMIPVIVEVAKGENIKPSVPLTFS